jgi:arginine decarboxylase
MNEIASWTIDKSNTLYGIKDWGADYFRINEKGNISVTPNGPNGPEIDLYQLVQEVSERDIELPLLLRFNGILRHRVRAIYNAFSDAIREYDYQGRYYPAYPIKVNQQRHVVDVLTQVGQEVSLGLEVGSKPELIAVLALHDNPNAVLLCNGYKDESYIELALMSKKVGRRPIIIIEKHSELELVLSVATRLNVKPEIGFRLKLSGKGAGRWERSGGDRAKFGLTMSDILQCIKILKQREQLDALRLLHCHVGSQLTTIAALRSALKEIVQLYVQLKRMAPSLTFVDVGGGLGVDYDGSKTNFSSSMNYTLEEYARDVVWTIDEICKQGNVPTPDIITESGRATVAYHSVLVYDVLGLANTFSVPCNPKEISDQTKNKTVKTLANLLEEVSPKNCQETLHDALELRNDLIQQFNLGLLSIEDRALGDECYWALLNALCKHSKQLHYIPEDLERLPALLTDTYFCNFSIFQSLPDSWAIQHIFPTTPIHRLSEEPTKDVVLADITCDSDGQLDRFADLRDVKRFLPCHALKPNEKYYFATFLVGAYQEILGDLHNLFGDTNAVHVEIADDGKIELSNIVYGDTIAEVLHYVQYDRNELCNRWRRAIESAVADGSLTTTESAELFRKYSQSFDGYTYLTGPLNSTAS